MNGFEKGRNCRH